MSINIDLLEKVCDHIQAHPELIDMTKWVREEDCGTVACIAGHTCLLSGYKAVEGKKYTMKRGVERISIQDEAQKLLGLDDEQAADLFFTGNWDMTLSHAYDKCRTPKQRAMVVVRAINKFIEEVY